MYILWSKRAFVPLISRQFPTGFLWRRAAAGPEALSDHLGSPPARRGKIKPAMMWLLPRFPSEIIFMIIA
jgi:hypothetical protein